MPKVRIYILDACPIFRFGLTQILNGEADMTVVGATSELSKAKNAIRTAQPDVVLMDLDLWNFGGRNQIDGVEVLRELVQEFPTISVTIITTRLADGPILRSMIAGAKGYLLKDIEPAEIKKSIRMIASGGNVIDPRVAEKVVSRVRFSVSRNGNKGGGKLPDVVLSSIDASILQLVCEGFSNREIGERVHLSGHTVKDHVRRIMDYLDVGRRAALVAQAIKRGLL